MLDKSLLQLNKISQRTNLIYSKSKHKTMHHRKKKKKKKKKTKQDLESSYIQTQKLLFSGRSMLSKNL